jgi:hypothetical protein
MMFCAMLSLLFYKKVVCLYLIPGHSHMIADRVLAWMKILFKESKCFIHLSLWNHVIRSTLSMHVSWILLEMISIFSLDGTAFWQNTSRNFHLDSHIVTFLSLKMVQSPINTFVTVRTKKQLTSNVQSLKPNRHRECLALELFGSVDQSEWSMKTLSLAKHTGVALKNAKLASLAKKYFSIPPERLFYYPNISSNIQEMIEEDEDDAPELVPAQSIARKKQEKRKI